MHLQEEYFFFFPLLLAELTATVLNSPTIRVCDGYTLNLRFVAALPAGHNFFSR